MNTYAGSSMSSPEKRAGSIALMALGAFAALACVSAIGTATTLVVFALDTSEPVAAIAPYGAECDVVAWRWGTTHCFRGLSDGTGKSARRDAAVVVQAQADSAR